MGKLGLAKQLVKAAQEAGADAVKGQAFLPGDVYHLGTMPKRFYDEVALPLNKCMELIAYGDSIGIDVFFTILSKPFEPLKRLQAFNKIAAAQFHAITPEPLAYKEIDTSNTFISMSYPNPDIKSEWLQNANLLYATGYKGKVYHQHYDMISALFKRQLGLSHNLPGFQDIIEMSKEYELPWVEKHFFLGTQIVWDAFTYRDCLHSINPNEFEQLRKALN